MNFLKKLNEKHPLFMEIVRFLIVGGIATVADMLAMGVVLYLFDASLYPHFYNVWYGGGEPSTLATVVGTGAGFLVGLVINYVCSVLFVFTHKGESRSVYGFALFTVLSAVGLAIHLVGMYVGYDLLDIDEWIVKIVLTIVVMIYNYVSKRLLLFRQKKAAPSAQTGGGGESLREEELSRRREETLAAFAAAPFAKEGALMKKLSIVVPCYNEEECIPLFYEKTGEVVSRMPVETEFVFVDDGSTDGTLSILRALAAKDKRVRYVSFSRNFGKEAGIYAGLRHATGDYVSLMDADLQDPPDLLPEMLAGLVGGGYDCVASRRVTRRNEPKIRSAFARLFYKIINKMTDTPIMDGARDFRMMTRRMTDAILSLPERERFSKELFSWVGFKTKWLEYENVERAGGKTKWSFKKLTKYAVDGIESATPALLKINLVFAVLFFLAAFGFAVADVVLAALGRQVSALFILLPVLFFTAAALFFGIFVLGEYVKKIFLQVRGRALYIERETEETSPLSGQDGGEG